MRTLQKDRIGFAVRYENLAAHYEVWRVPLSAAGG
jgi:hypothetical protein